MRFFQKRYLGLPILAIICGLIAGGVALAATVSVSHQGSVEVVAPPPPPPPPPPPAQTYSFKVYDAATGGTELAEGNSSFFALGQVQTGSVTTKTVYLEKTGTASLTVTPSFLWGATTPSGTITFSPTSVSLTDVTRQPLQVTFTAGASVAAPSNFGISYTATY